MVKGKKKATTPKKKEKKGGQLDPEEVKAAEHDPQGAEGKLLDDIFGADDPQEIISSEEQEVDEQGQELSEPDPLFAVDEHIEVKPTLKKAGEDDEEEVVEEEEVEEKPTQAAEEDEEEETPTSLDEATLMELLPEKFRGEDLTESLKKMQGSYGELESRKDRLEQENADNQRMIRELARPKRPAVPEAPKAAAKELSLSEDDEAALARWMDAEFSSLMIFHRTHFLGR